MTIAYQPGTRISEYVLEERIGGGAFGEVWQARHHVWKDDQVAIKLPTEPDYVRYLQAEGIVVHGLRHPNIIRVIGLDPYAETPYLVMELVDGPSLRQVIDEHTQGLPIEVVLTVLRSMLGAIQVAHDAGIIHRDLKPGNVLLNLGERPLERLRVDDVKIGDFGLGVRNEDTLRSLVMQSASIERDRESATLAGTLAYMAPEVRDGAREPSQRSDLFGIGVMLFEMLVGERPVGAEMPSTMRAEVPKVLDNVFRRLYARHDARYPSAQEVLQDLDNGLNAPPPPPTPQPTGHHLECPACQRPIAPGDQFCTHCGNQLVATVRRCSACGGYPGPDDRFCIFCGAGLRS